ncbi:capsid protein [Jeotgalibaca porci]|uniref:capsid protein n=1 Tax=Jeotgalibaca porci TaxID=1868793 RepID=UPI00359F254D
MAMKIYTQQYAGMLPNIFEAKSAYLRAFGGSIQTIVGAEADEDYLKLKISDTDVVIQNYSTDANVAFGTGTGNSNRFGPRKEVKSIDMQVPFDAPLSIHEGIDRYTVNDIPEQVVAERLALHAVAWAERYDSIMKTVISGQASATLTGDLSKASVTKLFADARKAFVNNKVSNSIAWVAYVTADVYNFLIDSELAKTDKNSSVNIDNQTMYKFKGFELVELPDDKFVATENAYFVADGVGQAGVAIPVARTFESEDFAGVALQGAGKLGKYIPEKNEKAILKATLTAVPAG